ncbi:MAG: hypothetical protein FH756_13795 [Firmicutes bacterium]|nr:hypothetical protein [Bacillota bacterium]
MAKNSKQEVTLTPSGHEADKELGRVPIKVSPSLQALIANQIDLIDMLEGKTEQSSIFVEQHKVEMSKVEEEIAGAFSSYVKKKEQAKERRLQKKKEQEEAAISEEEFVPSTDEGIVSSFRAEENVNTFSPEKASSASSSVHTPDRETGEIEKERLDSQEANFDFSMITGNTGSGNATSGLPSAKYINKTEPRPAEKSSEVDIRRVAIGASINALKKLLNRELTEQEIVSIEAQVDSYLE